MTFSTHHGPSDSDTTAGELDSTMRALEGCWNNAILILNAKKTKQILISKEQTSRVHKLGDQVTQIYANGEVFERFTLYRLLGV